MSEMPEFSDRLKALELVVGPLDRETSDAISLLRSHTTLLQALRDTQNSMQQVLNHQGLALGELVIVGTRHTERLSGLERGVGAVQLELGAMNRRLAALEEGQAALQEGQTALQEGQAEILRRLPKA